MRVTGNGESSLVFTAPHAIRALRATDEWRADYGTGGLAECLAEAMGGLAITAWGRQTGNANRDVEAGPFKVELERRLRPGTLVLDLHGMRDEWGPDLIIGLGPSSDDRSRELAAALRACGLSVAAGPPFDACHPGTITSFVQRSGGCALQIEVASRRRRPRTVPEPAAELGAALLNAFRLANG